MKLYCGIDLHSNNHYLTLIDENDRRILEKRLPNDLAATLKTLKPYRGKSPPLRWRVRSTGIGSSTD